MELNMVAFACSLRFTSLCRPGERNAMRHVLGDLVLAFGLLTRLPLPAWDLDASRSADAAWAWPLVGAVVGGIGAGAGALAMAFWACPPRSPPRWR